MSPTAPAFYPTVQSPAVPSPSQAGVNSWQVARPPSVTTSYVPGPYNSLVLSPAVFPYPGWGPYSVSGALCFFFSFFSTFFFLLL